MLQQASISSSLQFTTLTYILALSTVVLNLFRLGFPITMDHEPEA